MSQTVVTHSEGDTFALAEQIGRTLKAGTFVLLHGDLGAGKTVFVRGLAAGLGADPDTVTSPTFVLVQHYKGTIPLIHADLYRLNSRAAVDDLGLEELGSGAVVAVEWAERLSDAPDASITVKIEDAGGNRRRITVEEKEEGRGKKEEEGAV
jgi:tRNA threonylcarbamoyladenosine biosynthesis protein TsaE